MRKQKIQCVVFDQDVEVTASLDAALRSSSVLLDLKQVASWQQLVPVLQELRPHLLFCPRQGGESMELLESLQRYSPDTLLVWVSRHEWQGLTTWLMGVESCTLPLNDVDYFGQYIDFLLHYSGVKHDFRQCKNLLGVAELRCHWLVDYSWEAIAYISQGMHLYANNAYITLLGFESSAEVRSMPVPQLVDASERKTFEAMCKLADTSSKPSNRLLMTLRTLDGEHMRAEIRLIPAVLKGRRCTQLHVHPIERRVGKGAPLWKKDNPWGEAAERIQTAAEPRSPSALTAASRSSSPGRMPPTVQMPLPGGMKMRLHKLHRLRENQPTLYIAEPEFQQPGGKKLGYAALLEQLGKGAGRFRLDFWSLGQVIRKLSSRGNEKPGYLVFVSVGGAILNNESQLKQLIGLLNVSPAAASRVVIALRYEDCLAHVGQLAKVIKLLRAVRVRLAIDHLPDEAQALKFVRAVKPVLVRLKPGIAAVVIRKAETSRIKRVIYQLADSGCGVIVSDVRDKGTLQVVYSTAAAYAQGNATP
ncbi:MAG: EAL domain-containing protein [Thiothrix sp.]